METVDIDSMLPADRFAYRLPIYCEIIAALVSALECNEAELMDVLEYDEKWFDDTCMALSLPQLLRLINHIKNGTSNIKS